MAMARWFSACVMGSLVAAGPANAQAPSGLGAFRDDLQRILVLSPHERLELIAPGLPVPGAASEPAVRILFDGLPPGGSRSLTAAFATALEFAEAAPRHLTPGQVRDLRQAERILLRSASFWDVVLGRTPQPAPSRKVLQYEQYAMQLALAEQDAVGDDSPAARLRVDRLRRQWETYGHRAEVEAALERFHAITSADPALWLRDARQRATAASELMTHSPGAAVLAFGAPPDWTVNTGWTKVDTSNAAGDSMTCEIKRVSLQRPWLEQTVFDSRHWRWQGGSPLPASAKLSGNPDAAPLVPYIPVQLLLARHCSVVMRAGRLSMADPQVIGFVSQVPASSPEPDPQLWVAPLPPRARVQLPIGIVHGLSFGHGGANNQRGQVGPAPYWFRPVSTRFSVLVGIAPGAKLRSPGVLVGGGVRLLPGVPVRGIAGIRLGGKGQRLRMVVGLGLDFSLRADRSPER